MSALSYFNEPAPLAWDVAAAIFGASDTVGGLYDPSDLSTLFQDATGTTPAVPGSLVGLVLDARGEMGPELVTNGDFSEWSGGSPVGWTVAGTVNASNFVDEVPQGLRYVSDGTLLHFYASGLGSSLKLVEVELTIISGMATWSSGAAGGDAQGAVNISSSGTHRFLTSQLSIGLKRGSGPAEFIVHRFSIREVLNPPLSQPTTAARPILARMPKTGRRNLLTWTEDFSNAVWHNTDAVTQILENGEQRITFQSGSGIVARTSTSRINLKSTDVGQTAVLSCKIKAFDGSSVGKRVLIRNQTSGFLISHPITLTENFQDVVATGVIPSGATQGEFRFLNFGLDHTDQDFVVKDCQFEIRDTPTKTPYQRVTNAYDVTEEGVPDTYSLVYDLADDALITTLPQAINGDLLIAGTKGSIIEPVSYAAGSTFSIGPDTYTGGTPGIMRAIGDIVGVLLIDRNLTQNERDNLIRYYKGKGAKGLLVPGPELNTTGLSGFTLGAGWSVSDGIITRSGQTTSSAISKAIFASIDTTSRSYLFEIEASARSGDFLAAVNSPGADSVFFSSVGTGKLSVVVRATANRSNMGITGGGSATITASSISVRELRPQEDWT